MKTYCIIFIALRSMALSDSNKLSATPIQTALWETIVSSIIQRYVSVIYDIQIISKQTSISDNFLRTIPVPIQGSTYRLHQDSYVFLLPHNSSFLIGALAEVANATRSKYVVLIDCDRCMTVSWILQQFWQMNILNVVVIPIENAAFPIYSYFPFREGACFDPSPVLVDVFVDNFLNYVELFPARKVWNLHQCSLRVSTFTQLGVSVKNGEIDGRFSPVFKAFVHSLNFSPEFVNTEGVGSLGRAAGPVISGIRGDVYKEQAHIGFGLLMPLDSDIIDYDAQPISACLGWCTPASFKARPLRQLIFGEFDSYVWLMLCLSALCMVAANIVGQKFGGSTWCDGADEVYMNVWAALLQGSGKTPRYSTMSFRICWISWLASSVVISTGYLAALKSLRTAPFLEYSIKTLEDLANAGLQAWYADGILAVVKDASATNPSVAKLRTNEYVYPASYAGYMIQQLQHKNITSLTMDFMCRLFTEYYGDVVDVYTVPNSCMQVSQWHFFVVGQNSVFTDAVRRLMGRVATTGIIQRTLISRKNLQRSSDIKRRPITLQDTFPTFLALGCGWSLSVVVLLGEVFASRW